LFIPIPSELLNIGIDLASPFIKSETAFLALRTASFFMTDFKFASTFLEESFSLFSSLETHSFTHFTNSFCSSIHILRFFLDGLLSFTKMVSIAMFSPPYFYYTKHTFFIQTKDPF